MRFIYTIIAIAISAIIIYGGMALLTRYYKDKDISKVKKDFVKSVPVTIFVFAILFFQSLFNSNLLTKPIQNTERITTIQDAEKRIMDLESYTRFLEIDLDSMRFQFFLFIGAAFLLNFLLLAQIAIGWSKQTENK